MIVYLRVVPGFWVAVEEFRRPELRSHPLVIGGLPHQRGIVREANYPAQHAGVRPGMTLAQAHQQCPDGVFLMPNLSHYELVWEKVCDIVRRHTPLVEPVEMGQVVCDMSGCEGFRSNEGSTGQAIALEIERSTGITPSLGIASNRLVAQLASMVTEMDGVTVVDRGQERAFLANLPLSLLPGVDPRLALTFDVLGLTMISHFAALPSSAVKQRFGALGEQLHRYARGIDPRPILPPPEKSFIVARHECEDGSMDEAMEGIRLLADSCAGELQGRGVAGRLVGLTLIWMDGSNPTSPLPEQAELVESTKPTMLPASKTQPKRHHSEVERRTFPIPYRVHSSMLPQPVEQPAPLESPQVGSCVPAVRAGNMVPASGGKRLENIGRSQEVVAMVRTPINTAPPLLERVQQLLLHNWPRTRPQSSEEGHAPRLLAIELKIGEFARPSQLSLSNFDRLDGGGTLGGLSIERRAALVQQDEAFEARYGTTAFQHVTAVDAGNILTERRFRWETGLPWSGSRAVQKRS